MPMRKLKCAALAAVIGAIWPAIALAEVKVNFIDPERYTDANLRQRYGRSANEPAMREIETYLWRLGEAYLQPGDKLTIDVLDVDLAGRFEPWQFNYRDVRFMRQFTWPSIKVRYRLERGSAVSQVVEETVADRGYLTFLTTRDYSNIMPYEKVMLERWFWFRFVQRRPPA